MTETRATDALSPADKKQLAKNTFEEAKGLISLFLRVGQKCLNEDKNIDAVLEASKKITGEIFLLKIATQSDFTTEELDQASTANKLNCDLLARNGLI